MTELPGRAGGPTGPSGAADGHTHDSVVMRARRGDSRALSALANRHARSLRRWAHGRLPPLLRRLLDTGDLVQNALMQTLRRLSRVEPPSQRALRNYLRTAVVNQIRDEHRRLQRRGVPAEFDDVYPSAGPSPLDQALSDEARHRYLDALRKLRPADQELIVGHVELGYSHAQLGCMTGRSANAARVALRRALTRFTEHLADG